MTPDASNPPPDRPSVTGLTIRLAGPDDVPAILRLLWDDPQGRRRESLEAEDTERYAAAFRQIEEDPNSRILVAVLGTHVVGCLQLTVIPGLSYRGIRRALVEDVRVAQAHRGEGIGRVLLAQAEAAARAQGCRLMELFVHESRADAHRFYEGAGYTGAHRGFRKPLD